MRLNSTTLLVKCDCVQDTYCLCKGPRTTNHLVSGGPRVHSQVVMIATMKQKAMEKEELSQLSGECCSPSLSY